MNPAVIIYPGDGVSNGIDTAEEAAWLSNANAVAAFVASGGGLLAHTGTYSWLSAVLPGLTVNGTCNANVVTLTAAGSAAFPTVTTADLQAGPCHQTFAGNFGGLVPLARDAGNLVLLLGGGAGTTIIAPPPAPAVQVPTLGYPVLLLLIGALAFVARRRISQR